MIGSKIRFQSQIFTVVINAEGDEEQDSSHISVPQSAIDSTCLFSTHYSSLPIVDLHPEIGVPSANCSSDLNISYLLQEPSCIKAFQSMSR